MGGVRDLYLLADDCLPADIAADLGLASTTRAFFVRLSSNIEKLIEERDEARDVARHLKRSVDCWAYQAELNEAYPWLKESNEWLKDGVD
jgi:hypothetical protein